MSSAIRLFRGGFGHVSLLNVAGSLVLHAHTEAHVIVWLDGTAGEICVGEDVVRPSADVAVAVNALEPHSHAFPSDGRPGRFLAFYIDPDWAHRRRGLPSGAPLFSSPAIPLDPWLHRAAISVCCSLSADDGYGDMAAYETERLLDALFATAPADHRRPHAAAGYDFRVRKAIAFMKARMCERIGFDEVARSVGLSRPHFFALFKDQTGMTPNVYWNTLRMEEALRRLRSGDDSMVSVADQLGFTCQGNFSRFFRDHAGVSPSHYREAARATA